MNSIPFYRVGKASLEAAPFMMLLAQEACASGGICQGTPRVQAGCPPSACGPAARVRGGGNLGASLVHSSLNPCPMWLPPIDGGLSHVSIAHLSMRRGCWGTGGNLREERRRGADMASWGHDGGDDIPAEPRGGHGIPNAWEMARLGRHKEKAKNDG